MEADLASPPLLDRLFPTLADARRRRVPTELAERRGPTGVDDLARSIARAERDGRTAEPLPESARSIATATATRRGVNTE